jgi:hypothetical protein
VSGSIRKRKRKERKGEEEKRSGSTKESKRKRKSLLAVVVLSERVPNDGVEYRVGFGVDGNKSNVAWRRFWDRL